MFYNRNMFRTLTAAKMLISPHSRCCCSFVSRMRYLARLKEDDEACAAALQDSDIFLFHRLRPLLRRSDTRSFRTAAQTCSDVVSVLDRLQLEPSRLEEAVLIGCSEQNRAQFCLDLGELQQEVLEEEWGAEFVDLRKSFFLLSGSEAPLVAKAQALLRWHQTSLFCSATGQRTHRNRAGSQRSSGGFTYYPQMAPVVIVLVSDGKRCLLARQPSFPPGLYSALAGFCDMGESLEETLQREVAEEVGLQVHSITYSSSQHWPFPQSSFMIGCHASVSSTHTQLQVNCDELEDARWFTAEEVGVALQRKVPPSRGGCPGLWVPPPHAIGHRLIAEWAEQQRVTSGHMVT